MIEMVTRAEEHLARRRNAVFVPRALPDRIAPYHEVAPILRGACSLKDSLVDGAWRRMIFDFRTSAAIQNFVNGAAVMRYSQAGAVTSDHIIRIKNWPLVVPPPEDGKLDDFRREALHCGHAFIARYQDYFARNNERCAVKREALDPLQRVILVPGLGLIGLGRSKRQASVAADLDESEIATIQADTASGSLETREGVAVMG